MANELIIGNLSSIRERDYGYVALNRIHQNWETDSFNIQRRNSLPRANIN